MKRPPDAPAAYRMVHRLIGEWMQKRGISCRDFVELRLAACDRKLAAHEKRRMFTHRLLCSVCRGVEKQLKGLQRLTRQVWQRQHAPSNPLFFQQLEERLRQECQPSATADPPPSSTP